MKRILTVRDLTLSYEKQAVVSELNIYADEGDCLCILGENGSGKSTLVKSLMGLIKPMGGEIIYDGVKRSEIGYLPQQSAAQKDFPASVYEIVLSGTLERSMGFIKTENRREAEKNMELLGITAIKNKSFAALSGGQQQRVLLARAFCAAKKLLVLDEPVTGLDPLVSAELYSIIEEKNKKEGLTVISVSHAPERACHSASKILHLGGGGAAFFGDVNGYLDSEIGKKYLCADDHHHHSGERRKVQ